MSDYRQLLVAAAKDGLSDFVKERLLFFADYEREVFKDVVTKAESVISLQAGNISNADYVNAIRVSDTDRHLTHNIVIDACRQLNSLCDRYGLEHICPETEDRHEIAKFVGKLVNENYFYGIGEPEMVEEREDL
jgi:hypothetical protein